LDGGFGEPARSHLAQAIAALPGAEDFLAAAAHPADGLVVGGETKEGLSRVLSPHSRSNDARDPALGADRHPEMVPAIPAVGEYLTGIVG
jgi:hypothetical protein